MLIRLPQLWSSLANGNLVPPRPAVAIGSAQSAVPTAARSSLPRPSFSAFGFSPNQPLFHRPPPHGLGALVSSLSWRTLSRCWGWSKPGTGSPHTEGLRADTAGEANVAPTTRDSIFSPSPQARGRGNMVSITEWSSQPPSLRSTRASAQCEQMLSLNTSSRILLTRDPREFISNDQKLAQNLCDFSHAPWCH